MPTRTKRPAIDNPEQTIRYVLKQRYRYDINSKQADKEIDELDEHQLTLHALAYVLHWMSIR